MMDVRTIYILLGILIGLFTIVLATVSIYFCRIYKKEKSDDKKKQNRKTNKQSESAAGNYFQAGTFHLPGKRATPGSIYDSIDLEQQQQGQSGEITGTKLVGIIVDKKYTTDLEIDNDSDKDSGKGTASYGESEPAPSEGDVNHDDDGMATGNSDIASVDEVGVDLERTHDPDFLNKEREKIKHRAEQSLVNPMGGRGYAPRYRRRTEPLEPLFEHGEEENPVKPAHEVFNY